MNTKLKLILAFIILFLTFILGEIFARLVVGPPAAFLYSGSFRVKMIDFDIYYGVNNNMRRTTCSNLRNNRIMKIAVIGDSFVFGQGIRDCNDFVSLLNQGQSSFFFENYGVLGIGIDEYNIIIRDFINNKYFAVFLMFYGNDISGSSIPRSYLGKLAENISIFSLVRKAKRKHIVEKESKKYEAMSFNNTLAVLSYDKNYFINAVNPNENDIQIFKKKFRKLIGKLKDKNIKTIYVSMVPEGHTVSNRLRNYIIDSGGKAAPFGQAGKSYKLIKDLSKQHGLIFIETFKSFLEHGEEAYFPHDLHWSENGHKIIAQIVINELGLIYME